MKRILVCLMVLLMICLSGFAMAEEEKTAKLNYKVEEIESFTGYVRTHKEGALLRLREHPQFGARVLKKLEPGTELKVIGVWKKFYQVEVDGLTGFVQSRYVSTVYPLATAPLHTYYPPMRELADPVIVSISPARRGGHVNMRTGPSRSEPVAKYLYENQILLLLAVDRVWVKVQVPETEQIGYVMRHFVNGL